MINELEKIGIIGCGAMGTGIAQVAAVAGHEVLIFDQQPEARSKSLQTLQKFINRLAEKGVLGNQEAIQCLGRIYFVDDIAALASSELVVEAIVEDLAIKQQVLKDIENRVSARCILATNTSSLSITAIASGLSRPERAIGLHFFNPAPLMDLVEITPALQTSQETVRLAEQIMISWRKNPVKAKDTPGFIVNRLARPFYSEALRLYDEGYADIPTIDYAMTSIGKFKMGPFILMDFIGNDINLKVTETMYRAYYQEPRYKPSFTQKQLVDAGYLGRKTGKGFYSYPLTNQNPSNADPVSCRKIFERVLSMLINEAYDAWLYGIASPEDLDLAMKKGANYPLGLIAWSHEFGIKKIIRILDGLFDQYHDPRYRCSVKLRESI